MKENLNMLSSVGLRGKEVKCDIFVLTTGYTTKVYEKLF